MEIVEENTTTPYLQLSYGPHPRQVVSLYDHMLPFSETSQLPSLIFIHGGAWRDHTNTDRDADEMYKHLVKAIPLCSVDYRLSDEIKHPLFLEDVVAATRLCLKRMNNDKVSFIGHSVGALLALQCLEAIHPEVSVKTVYLVEGIYDLEQLLKEYPDYQFFVDDAHDNYKDVTPTTTTILEKLRNVEVHIIQSYEDELLSMGQTLWLQQQLLKLQIPFHLHVAHLGEHNDVYVSKELAEYVNRTYF